MRHKYMLRGTYISVLFLIFFSFNTYAQVGIGTIDPNPNAKLDITSTVDEPGGLLLPRVALTALNNMSPLSGPVLELRGMTIYNTAAAGSGVNRVTPGFYYHDGTTWVRISEGSGPNANWKLRGNAGTTAGTNFIGTTDNIHFESFTNNASRMRIQNNGQITMGFGASMANSGQQFNVVSTFSNGTAIGGYGVGAGYGVFGQNKDSGNGVFGLNTSSGNGVYGRNQGFGPGVKGESWYGLGWSVQGVDGPIFSDNLLFGDDAFFGLTDDLTSNALWGVNLHTRGVGILGGSNDVSVLPQNGAGVSGSGTRLGVYGYAGQGLPDMANDKNAAGSFTLDSDSDPSTDGRITGNMASAMIAGYDYISPTGTGEFPARNSLYGGYFSGGNENYGTRSYAFAGIKYNADWRGEGGTNYKIMGNGTNSTLINDAEGNPRIMFSPEAPEILFQDFGVGNLVNGQARIDIDPILKKSLYVDNEHPLKVFVTLEGDCNGIYVTDKSIDGFTVKELQNGRSNISFSWQIVANRADDKDANGNISSKHVGLRLPIGPGPIDAQKASIKHPEKIYNLEKDTKQPESNSKSGETLIEEELIKIRKNVLIGKKPKERNK